MPPYPLYIYQFISPELIKINCYTLFVLTEQICSSIKINDYDFSILSYSSAFKLNLVL